MSNKTNILIGIEGYINLPIIFLQNLKKQSAQSSIYLAVLQLVHILPVLVLAREFVGRQETLLSQLDVETLVFALPPLPVGLALHRTLLVSAGVEQFSLLSPQVVEDALVAGYLQVLVFFLASEFGEVVVDDS